MSNRKIYPWALLCGWFWPQLPLVVSMLSYQVLLCVVMEYVCVRDREHEK